MKTFITTFMLALVITYTHVSFSMRSMADQPLAPTTPETTPERAQEVQQIPDRRYPRTPRVPPEHHIAVRTPAGLLPVDTPLATTPDLEHDVHMIKPHIGKVVPRDYAHWTFD